MKKILCLDFDGVIHSYISGWKGPGIIPDVPVQGAIDFIIGIHKYFDIAIHSSRLNYPEGAEAIREYLVKHGIERNFIATQEEMGSDFNWQWENRAIVLAKDKPPAFVTLDDRAITFKGVFPNPSELLDFKPWNEK